MPCALCPSSHSSGVWENYAVNSVLSVFWSISWAQRKEKRPLNRLGRFLRSTKIGELHNFDELRPLFSCYLVLQTKVLNYSNYQFDTPSSKLRQWARFWALYLCRMCFPAFYLHLFGRFSSSNRSNFNFSVICVTIISNFVRKHWLALAKWIVMSVLEQMKVSVGFPQHDTAMSRKNVPVRNKTSKLLISTSFKNKINKRILSSLETPSDFQSCQKINAGIITRSGSSEWNSLLNDGFVSWMRAEHASIFGPPSLLALSSFSSFVL